jgi:monoamine oxidase/SAM-dependent methyltransferase
MDNVAILGGGPGGLLTAYLLEQNYRGLCTITLFEATERTGGKISTQQFDSASVIYEAGLTELYDYRTCGPDPLFELVQNLGLKPIPMRGQSVVLNGRLLRTRRDICKFSPKALTEIDRFRRRASRAMSHEDWYEGNSHFDNTHPWSKRSCQEILEEVADPIARRYLTVAVHSDLATEPHCTNGLNGLKNFLMDVPGYLRLYSVAGGLEQIPRLLERRLAARIRPRCRASRVEKTPKGMYRVFYRSNERLTCQDFDALFIALPHSALGMIEWGGERLAKAMQHFIAYYDRPGHYLRVSALFQTAFWQKHLRGSWFTLDAFGGCCVYDEGRRYGAGSHGVLSWLLAGNSAIALSNHDDEVLVHEILGTLPGQLKDKGRQALLEARVHRWLASVSGQPGGFPVKDFRSAHAPEREEHPGIFMVGDYLFDSTLNGILDSAQCATDLWHAWKLKRKVLELSARNGSARVPRKPKHIVGERSQHSNSLPDAETTQNGTRGPLSRSRWSISRSYFKDYHEGRSYQDAFSEYFDAHYIGDLIEIAWGIKPPYRLLDAGSASGLTLAEFGKCGIEAWGVEKNKYIHKLTPEHLKGRNLLGDACNLKSFQDNAFDFVYETCLGYVGEREVPKAIRELRRVAKRGVIFGSITTDMNPDLFNRSNLIWGMKTLRTLWEWSELFMENGFDLAVTDREVMSRLWRCEKKYNAGDHDWYRNKKSLAYCFYTKRAGLIR